MTKTEANTIWIQKALVKGWYQTDKRYIVAHGGRGSSKSMGAGALCITYAATHPKSRILCVRGTQNKISESSLQVLKDIIYMMHYEAYFDITENTLKCKNGTEFLFYGAKNYHTFKSLQNIHMVWIDEATELVPDAWDVLIPTIRAKGSRFIITFNADNKEDWVYKQFVTSDRPDAYVTKINYTDNPHFPEVLRHEMEYCKRVDYEKYLWIWEGNCRQTSHALIFKGKFRSENFDTPKDAQFYYGADWGFSNDPTTLIRCFITDNVLYVDYDTWGIGVDIDETPELFDRVPGSRKWNIIADSARPETISYVNKQGFNISGAKKGPGSIDDGISYIRSFKEIVIHPRAKHVLDEFKTYSWKLDRLTGQPTPIPEDKNNHCIDALRYALEGVKSQPRARWI